MVSGDIVLVTVDGDTLREAVQKRIAVLEVEAEAERKEEEEWHRDEDERIERETTWANAKWDENQRKLDEYNALPRWKRWWVPAPEYLFYGTLAPRRRLVVWTHPAANRLAELKSHLPCPDGSIQISLDLAHELGLVTGA